MFSNPLTTQAAVVEQHSLNQQNLRNLKRDTSPLASAALQLAQTARDMKAHVAATSGTSKTLVFAPQGRSIQAKELIKLIESAKDALKSFASKAESLDREVDFFSNHQEGLFRGNMAMFPQADKVNWCTGQVEKILKRASKLGAEQAPKVGGAMNNLRTAAQYTRHAILSDLDTRVAALNRNIH